MADYDLLAASVNTSALSITTYVGGNNEITHPDVVFIPGGWNGYEYWMAATPYEATNSATENPSIFVSSDGLTWSVPPGGTNPVVAALGGGQYNSDNDLVYAFGQLWLFWRVTGAGNDEIWVKSSSDGVTWGSATKITTYPSASSRPVAPGIVFDGTTWHMWAVDIVPSPNVVKYWTASSPTGTWMLQGTTDVAFSSTEPWHLDAALYGSQFVLLIMDCTIDSSGAAGDLWLATSYDGLTWTVGSSPFVQKPPTGVWAQSFYRSTLMLTRGSDGAYARMWVAGKDPLWKIGYAEAPLSGHRARFQNVHGIADSYLVAILASKQLLSPYVFGDGFDRADTAVSLGTSDCGISWTASTGTLGVSSKKAYAPAVANSRSYAETGISDLRVEVDLPTVNATGQEWLIFRLQDGSNYWRFGNSGNVYALQSVVAGVTTTVITCTNCVPASGDRIAVEASGTSISVFVNGRNIASTTSSTFQTQTKVGIQTQNTTSRFDNLTVRSL